MHNRMKDKLLKVKMTNSNSKLETMKGKLNLSKLKIKPVKI